MTAHLDLHQPTFTQGVRDQPAEGAAKRRIAWLLPVGLLAVGVLAAGTTTLSADRDAGSTAPIADSVTASADPVTLHDATIGIPDGGLDLGALSPTPVPSMPNRCFVGVAC